MLCISPRQLVLLQFGRVLTNRTRHINLTQKSEKKHTHPQQYLFTKGSLSFFQTTLNVACWEHNMTWSGHSWHLIYFEHLRPRVYPSDPYRSDPPKTWRIDLYTPPPHPPNLPPAKNQGLWTIMVSLSKASYFWGWYTLGIGWWAIIRNPFDKQDTGVTDLAGLHTFS